MLLISATPSPFARKIRIAMIEKGLSFEIQNEIPWHSDSRTPLWNPLEQLPILIPDEGEPVYESTYIMEWLDLVYPVPSMLPDDTQGILEAKRIQVIAEGLTDATVLLFWEAQRAYPSDEWTRRQLRKVSGGLHELDRRIGQRTYFVGDRFGLGDIATIAALGTQDVAADSGILSLWQSYDPAIAQWRTLYPNLCRFELAHRDRPSVRDTAPVMFGLSEKVV